MSGWWGAILVSLACFGLNGQTSDPATEAAEKCAACHPAEVKAHLQTKMAHALMPVQDSAFFQNLLPQPLHEPGGGYFLSYSPLTGAIQVTASRGLENADGLVKWVVGAGAQGQTPLVIGGGAVRESRVSYFTTIHQFGITAGQEPNASASATAALGLAQTDADLKKCLGCHTTKLDAALQPVLPGVQCERCHAGAERHAVGQPVKPFNPGKLKARDQVAFCGGCHRNAPPVGDAELENLRFQPLRLSKSRCYLKAEVRCTTCHVAHRDAHREDAAFYNAKCESCHEAAKVHADARQSGNCIGCHMPQVQLHPGLRFTDHYIRIVRSRDPTASVMLPIKP